MPEIDTQLSIIDIIAKLPLYLHGRWKRNALEKKKDAGRYSTLQEFVEFVSEVASELNDLAYGKMRVTGKQSIEAFHTMADTPISLP